ncbi:ABC transporter permease [Tuanshanicoccus lijuaniae]|uniref:ABC transporter permease n=1 Tax=Aerococcaceae bacterium zg-1292 TaxID=2774330 RepID=UPI001BD8F6A5|nr:ABC-2 family transporter protein [Aerococcaceae bacterium zg-A91]MBS4458725.1 ABC-2 family transporter protein [Aerococcaceae bacterium zg-BR33]
MKKYIVMFLNRVSVQLSYKFNFLTNLFNNLLGILVAAFTWIAIFKSSANEVIGGFTLSQMLFYIVIVNFSTVLFSTGTVVQLGAQVRMGKLTTHLLRPYSILLQSFAEYLGDRFIYLVLYLSVLIVSLGMGYSPYYLLHVLVFLVCNAVMYFTLMSLIGTLGFWLIQMWPLRAVMNAVYMILGGLLFPLNLLPESLYLLLQRNPFALVAYQYTLALQNQLTIAQIQVNILYSIAWAVICYVAYKLSFKKGLLRYEGMGA